MFNSFISRCFPDFRLFLIVFVFNTGIVGFSQSIEERSYPIVDTGMELFFNNRKQIEKPDIEDDFYGQDAQYIGNVPNYKLNDDGTISDMVTGLIWQKNLFNEKYTYEQALIIADTCTLAGYTDWRLPTIKELYSLIMFYGEDVDIMSHLNNEGFVPFINTEYFDFRYGGILKGERVIDAQYVSSTKYVGKTMNENPTVFGVNFADGRIKGYPISSPRGQKYFEVRLVRGNQSYGINKFVDNVNGTISDNATGLMWSKEDSKIGMNWKDALCWIKQKNKENYLGYDDWRLPDAKELQSIVDYDHAPNVDKLPAINPLFICTPINAENQSVDYPFYWTSTTHVGSNHNGTQAVYISFGKALGWMHFPFSQEPILCDVHGAGAQRSDPKEGNPQLYKFGRGPQGDVVRINNYVRLVRTME